MAEMAMGFSSCVPISLELGLRKVAQVMTCLITFNQIEMNFALHVARLTHVVFSFDSSTFWCLPVSFRVFALEQKAKPFQHIYNRGVKAYRKAICVTIRTMTVFGGATRGIPYGTILSITMELFTV